MAKGRKRKAYRAKEIVAGECPTAEQMRSGEFDREFVTHAESATKAMAHKRRQSRSALEYMRGQGSLTDEQFYSAQQIAQIAEQIERTVAVSCASLEARVDCSGSARDIVNESLYRVRAEGAYTEWRSRLPLPRRMFIDMVTLDAGLSRIAAEHNMGWPKAKQKLLNALDQWPAIFAKYAKKIGQDELDRQHARLRA